jgi:hypothetical protein
VSTTDLGYCFPHGNPNCHICFTRAPTEPTPPDSEAVRLLPGLRLAEKILREGGFKSANVIERQIGILELSQPAEGKK